MFSFSYDSFIFREICYVLNARRRPVLFSYSMRHICLPPQKSRQVLKRAQYASNRFLRIVPLDGLDLRGVLCDSLLAFARLVSQNMTNKGRENVIRGLPYF